MSSYTTKTHYGKTLSSKKILHYSLLCNVIIVGGIISLSAPLMLFLATVATIGYVVWQA